MIADLLDDHVEPERVAQITTEVIHQGLDYASAIVELIGPSAAWLGFRRGDGMALFDHLLTVVTGPRSWVHLL